MKDWSVRIVTDGGPNVGLGHVRRAFAVADELDARGADVRFLVPTRVREAGYLSGSDHPVESLERREYIKKRNPARTIWIFDLPNRPWVEYEPLGHAPMGLGFTVALKKPYRSGLLFDLIIDGNPHGQSGDLDAHASCIRQGLEYAIVRDEFSKVEQKLIRNIARRLLITVGGSDPHRLTLKILAGLDTIPEVEKIDIVIGPMFGDEKAKIKAMTRGRGHIALHEGVDHMKSLFEQADVALTAGGTTLLEAARSGTPAVVMLQAEDQRSRSEVLGRAGVVEFLGEGWNVQVDEIQRAASDLIHDPQRRAKMSRMGQQMVDGLGVKRVVDEILAFAGSITGEGVM